MLMNKYVHKVSDIQYVEDVKITADNLAPLIKVQVPYSVKS